MSTIPGRSASRRPSRAGECLAHGIMWGLVGWGTLGCILFAALGEGDAAAVCALLGSAAAMVLGRGR